MPAAHRPGDCELSKCPPSRQYSKAGRGRQRQSGHAGRLDSTQPACSDAEVVGQGDGLRELSVNATERSTRCTLGSEDAATECARCGVVPGDPEVDSRLRSAVCDPAAPDGLQPMASVRGPDLVAPKRSVRHVRRLPRSKHIRLGTAHEAIESQSVGRRSRIRTPAAATASRPDATAGQGPGQAFQAWPPSRDSAARG